MLSEDTGKELLCEMKQKQLSQFNTAEVNRMLSEIAFVETRINQLKEKASECGIKEELSINFALLRAYSDRCRRIIQAYKVFRIQKIVDNQFAKKDIRSLLSSDEVVFKNEHAKILDEYVLPYRNLDFSGREPPMELYVQIVTLEDCGIVMCEDDFIELKKGRLYFLKRTDIAHLISQNLVQII